MQARYYDPMIGLFYSNNPADVNEHISRGNPAHGVNRYVYANKNPYKYIDPDGRIANAYQLMALPPKFHNGVNDSRKTGLKFVASNTPILGETIAVTEIIIDIVVAGNAPVQEVASFLSNSDVGKGSESKLTNYGEIEKMSQEETTQERVEE